METNNETQPEPQPISRRLRLPLSHYVSVCDPDNFLDGLVLGIGTDPLPEKEVTTQEDMKSGDW